MHKDMIAVLVLFGAGILLFAIPSFRTWGTILLLLALIFYALFANPMQAVHEHSRSKKLPHSSPRKKKKK